MVCEKSEWVERFLAGVLDEGAVADMEAHIEQCEECFLRVAAGAADLPEAERASLRVRSTASSRLAFTLNTSSLAGTTIVDRGDGSGAVSSRQTIGPYVVTGFLGVGGMSMVYRAKHQTTGREVAIKTVKMPFVASWLSMLRQEIEFLREAQHPGIVTVLDSDLIADDPWYAMELFEEPTLQEFNRRLWNEPGAPDPPGPGALQSRPAAGGRLPEVLRLFAQLCDPVAFLHGAGMVHGDIKPSNIFLRADGRPVLMDFGLAARTKGTIGRETLDVTGRIRGTLPYIAPEIIRGKLPDARADLYAVGCMLYESIVGSPPFTSRNGTKIIDMHLSVVPAPASARVAGVPVKVDELLARLLAKDPADRFGHASALAASLWSIAETLSSAPGYTSIAVSSEPTTPLFRPPLVGRDGELRSILDSVRNAQRASRGRMILLAGESGIGKTFLTAEVAQTVLITGADVVTSECLPTTPSSGSDAGGAPLQGFRRLFEKLRDRCRERGPAEVDRLFGDRLALLAEYLPAVRHLVREPAPAAAAPVLPASAARERIVEAVIETVGAYGAGRPTLLALDDLQWADDLTLAVLDRMDDEFFENVPVVVLGTYRSDEASEPIRRLGAKPSTTVLQLGRLAKDDTGAIVGGMLSMGTAPPALTEYVHQQAEGVPFFAAEYLRALVAAGALVHRGGAWSFRTPSPDGKDEWLQGTLPRTLQELIRGRLGRLKPEIIAILEAGAVLGRRFSLSRVGRMLDRPVSELAPVVAASTAAEIARSDGLDELTFVHDKIRETLYFGLGAPARSRLHVAAAHAMDDGDSTPPEHYGQIGHHLRDGGEVERAIGYLEKAGAHALRMAASGDAERFFREAIDMERQSPSRQPLLRRARWHRERADALQGLGLMAEAAASLKESAALLGRPFPRRAPALAGLLVREVVRQVGHRVSPRLILRPRPEQADANEEIVRVFDRMHQASFYLGNDGDLVLSTTVSLNASERAGASPHLTVAYTNAAMMAGVLPLRRLAERYFQLAARTAAAAPDPAAQSWLLQMEGAYRTWQGDRTRSIACLEQAISLFAERGFARRLDEAECARVGVDLFAGLHAPALARLEPIEPRARRRRDLQIQCWITLQRVEAHTLRNEHETALEHVRRAKALLPSLSRPEHIWAISFEAYLLHRTGHVERAFQLVQQALALIAKGPPVHSHCVGAYDRVAETAVALASHEPPGQRRRQYVRAAERACTVVERAMRVFPIAEPAAALHRGALQLATRRGRPSAVLRRWHDAIQKADALSLPIQEVRLRTAIIRLLVPDDPDAAIHRQRARHLLASLGLKGLESPDPSHAIADLDGAGAGVKVEGEVELFRR
jgi:serine/threonine protein kinase/tetratricopeptide (TPR) repeat protein